MSDDCGRGFPWKLAGAIVGLPALAALGTFAVQSLRGKDSVEEDALLAGAGVFASVSIWEALWWVIRRQRRADVFEKAQSAAQQLGRPLVVIGAPDGGTTSGYGCGDVTIDLLPSSCPNAMQLDVTQPLPFADNSVVIFCSCVLEYVSDPGAAIAEIQRVSGGYAYFVGVEPWTLNAFFYPGAKQTLPAAYR